MLAELAETSKGSVLLSIARASISTALGRELHSDESASWLQEPGACFITLTKQGELRGCIGTLEAHRPLLQDVKSNALAAAFYDPRFPALILAELDDTSVEVSLLSAMTPILFASERDALRQLKPVVHGVVLMHGRHRSTFLPQVWEQLPNVVDFMAQLKCKAGLAPDFWSDEIKLAYYTVSKWKESEGLAQVDAHNSR